MSNNEEIKPVEYYKQNAEEDYITTPISVLRYISTLEEQTAPLHQKIKELEEEVERLNGQIEDWNI